MDDLGVDRGADRRGGPPVPLEGRDPPCSRMNRSATRSRSSVERPGSTAASTVSIVPATIRPAFRIFSISSGDFRMITGAPPGHPVCGPRPRRATPRRRSGGGGPARVEALERRRLLPVDGQPPPSRELVVVGPSFERRTTDVAQLVFRRRLELHVIGPTAVGTGVAPEQPPNGQLAADRELQHGGERLLRLLERPLQRLGLRGGPRKPSRMNPSSASDSSRRSITIDTTTPSGTYSPRSMYERAWMPSLVPRCTWSRRMSPVEIWGMP